MPITYYFGDSPVGEGPGPQIVLHSFSDRGESDSDGITTQTLPRFYIDFTGLDLDPSCTLQAWLNGDMVATAVLSQLQLDGGYIKFGQAPLEDGDYELKLAVAGVTGFGNTLEFTIDNVAPVLTTVTGTATGETTATFGFSTNEASGTKYGVITNSDTPPTAEQVIAGTDASDSPAQFAANSAVVATGAQTFNGTGLLAGATYYGHSIHVDAAGNVSDVISSASFTTTSGTTYEAIFGNRMLMWQDAIAQMSNSDWEDQSDNDKDLLQATVDNRPTANANGLSSGKPGLVFSKTAPGDTMQTGSVVSHNGGNQLTVLHVCKIPTGGGEGRRWSFSSSVSDFDGVTQCMGMRNDAGDSVAGYRDGSLRSSKACTPDTPMVIIEVYDGTNHIIYVDGVAGTPSPIGGNFATNNKLILSSRIDAFDGFVDVTTSEFLMADVALSAGQVATLNGLAETKWGI
jgi:hypothetical protein